MSPISLKDYDSVKSVFTNSSQKVADVHSGLVEIQSLVSASDFAKFDNRIEAIISH